MIVNSLNQSLVIVPQLLHDDRSIRHRAYDPYHFKHKFRIVTFSERLIEYISQFSVKFLDLREK